MKNMKKILCAVLAVMMLMCLVGCGSDKGGGKESSAVKAFVSSSEADAFVSAVVDSAGGMVEAELEARGSEVVIKLTYTSIDSAMLKSVDLGEAIDMMFEDGNILSTFQAAEPEISKVTIEIYGSDGKLADKGSRS